MDDFCYCWWLTIELGSNIKVGFSYTKLFNEPITTVSVFRRRFAIIFRISIPFHAEQRKYRTLAAPNSKHNFPIISTTKCKFYLINFLLSSHTPKLTPSFQPPINIKTFSTWCCRLNWRWFNSFSKPLCLSNFGKYTYYVLTFSQYLSNSFI